MSPAAADTRPMLGVGAVLLVSSWVGSRVGNNSGEWWPRSGLARVKGWVIWS